MFTIPVRLARPQLNQHLQASPRFHYPATIILYTRSHGHQERHTMQPQLSPKPSRPSLSTQDLPSSQLQPKHPQFHPETFHSTRSNQTPLPPNSNQTPLQPDSPSTPLLPSSIAPHPFSLPHSHNPDHIPSKPSKSPNPTAPQYVHPTSLHITHPTPLILPTTTHNSTVIFLPLPHLPYLPYPPTPPLASSLISPPCLPPSCSHTHPTSSTNPPETSRTPQSQHKQASKQAIYPTLTQTHLLARKRSLSLSPPTNRYTNTPPPHLKSHSHNPHDITPRLLV